MVGTGLVSDDPPRREVDPPKVRVANAIREDIRSKRMMPGEQIPTITELVNRFHVSRNTVVAAIQILKDEGLVIGQRGWGTFVAGEPSTS